MFIIKDHIHINAPIERCFLLSTSIELVARTIGMKPVKGKTSGLVVAGDEIDWRGWKFGMPQRHRTLITEYDAPAFFQDEMLLGRFKTFQHDHFFTELDGKTLLKDIVRFTLPLESISKPIGRFLLVPHIHNLVNARFELIRRIAETDQWREFLPQE